MNQETVAVQALAIQNLEDLADVTTDLQETMNQETAAAVDAEIQNPEDLLVLVMVLEAQILQQQVHKTEALAHAVNAKKNATAEQQIQIEENLSTFLMM